MIDTNDGLRKTERNNEMLRRYDAGENVTAMAEEFGISATTAYMILARTRRRNARDASFNWLHPDCPRFVYLRLERIGITSIEQLRGMTEWEVRKNMYFGRKSWEWVKRSLEQQS